MFPSPPRGLCAACAAAGSRTQHVLHLKRCSTAPAPPCRMPAVPPPQRRPACRAGDCPGRLDVHGWALDSRRLAKGHWLPEDGSRRDQLEQTPENHCDGQADLCWTGRAIHAKGAGRRRLEVDHHEERHRGGDSCRRLAPAPRAASALRTAPCDCTAMAGSGRHRLARGRAAPPESLQELDGSETRARWRSPLPRPPCGKGVPSW